MSVVDETKATLTKAIEAIEMIRDGLHDAPKPEPETAFQGLVREYLKGHWRTSPWEDLEKVHLNSVPNLRDFFDATLDLAIREVNPIYESTIEHIEALKEPTP